MCVSLAGGPGVTVVVVDGVAHTPPCVWEEESPLHLYFTYKQRTINGCHVVFRIHEIAKL